MRKEYRSPEIEIVELVLSDVLSISKDEVIATEGFVEEPEDFD